MGLSTTVAGPNVPPKLVYPNGLGGISTKGLVRSRTKQAAFFTEPHRTSLDSTVRSRVRRMRCPPRFAICALLCISETPGVARGVQQRPPYAAFEQYERVMWPRTVAMACCPCCRLTPEAVTAWSFSEAWLDRSRCSSCARSWPSPESHSLRRG